mgnify:CR=1 FL=1
MSDATLGTPEQLRDPDYTPPLAQAIPLGIQHVLAMFVSNVTPAIIVAGAAGIGFGSDQGALGFPDMSYLIQMSMLFAGIATLIQTIGMGPVGARLPLGLLPGLDPKASSEFGINQGPPHLFRRRADVRHVDEA